MARVPKDVKSYLYPSRFGSHKVMINEDKTAKLSDGNVVLTDEHGDYVTARDRLDTGLADPNRLCTSRLGKLFDKKAVEEKK